MAVRYERWTVNSFWVFILFWIIPVLLSQDSTLPLNSVWDVITYRSVYYSIFGFLTGYIISGSFRIRFRGHIKIKNLSLFNLILQVLSIVSFAVCFLTLKGFPLLSNDILNARMNIQSMSPLAWTLTQSAFLSANLRSVLKNDGRWRPVNEGLLWLM